MVQKLQIDFGGRPFSIETGRVARQANGAVLVQYGETVVLVTAVTAEKKREGIDFIPLTVNYQEMTYAQRIRRFLQAGRPSVKLDLSVIDRPLRPFSQGSMNQVIATVLSGRR
jgi:polyribonucleotide nucleotidyltransferase